MFHKAIFVGSLIALSVLGQAPPTGRGGGRGGPPIKSPEISTDGKLTVRLRAPNAKEVFLTGAGLRLAMQKDEQGVWTATTDVLKPDVYIYQFSVDGLNINDPSNPHLATSAGSVGRSVVTVPGAIAWSPVAGVAKGAVARYA